MRTVLTALAAAALLAVASTPAHAQTLIPPAGQYLGKADNGDNVIFSLDQSNIHHIMVVNFTLHGHHRFSHAHFYYSRHDFGSFRIELHDGFHAWGHWSQENYGHMSGGFSYIHNHQRIVHEYTASADGF
jgi:hypothetical protein